MRIVKNIIKIFLICFAIIVVFPLVYFGFHLISDPKLVETHYTLENQNCNHMRIVQLSDLHNEEFGDNNVELVQLITEQEPDIIVMTGDMILESEEDTSIIVNLISKLNSIAPVYYGLGNSETSWNRSYSEKKGVTIEEILRLAGATVIECSYEDIVINEVPVRIAGYSGYYRNPIMKTGDQEIWQQEKVFFDEFESYTGYKILLNHIPTPWLEWNGINWEDDVFPAEEYDIYGHAAVGFDVDLVFCGHYHGGMWNLPFIGAVYVPYSGFNPDFSKGIYKGSKATCVVSAGLGNEYSFIPRINNPAEVVVLDIVS